MDQDQTIAAQIFEKDPEAFDLLKKMLDRPALFVGTSRFDYIDRLFGGYCLGRGHNINHMPSQEMQYWLLHTQSASLHSGSLQGRSLFYRCFGSEQMAFDQYKEFLNSILIQHPKDVDRELFEYEERYEVVHYDWEDDVPSDYNINLAHAVLDNVQRMIDDAGIVHDEIRIYIRKESLFNQVRFLIHTTDGWMNDSKMISNPDNHEVLIAIHVNTRNASTDALRECGCDVNNEQKYNESLLLIGDTIADDMTFLSEYMQWRDMVITA